jgi:probable phosphoglycerate mutase
VHLPSVVVTDDGGVDPGEAEDPPGSVEGDADARPGPSEPTRLALIRHGESNVTVSRTIGGHRTCSGLSGLGRVQCERLRDRLAETGELPADHLVSSNFARAIESAEIIGPALGDLPLEIDADFGEHDPGPDIDGMTFDTYVERFGTPEWHGDPHAEVFPGGETTAEFHLRVGAAVSRLIDRYAGRTIVVVCHGGVVDAVMRQVLRAPATGSFVLQTRNTSITETARVDSATWRLVRYNDSAHLAGLPDATR